jgi:signal transduction histidine kinase
MVIEYPEPAAILQALPLPVGVIDPDGRLLGANPIFSSVPDDLLSSPDFAAFLAHVREEGAASATLCIGPACVEAKGRVVPASGGHVVVALVPDRDAWEGGCRLAVLAGIMRAATAPTSLQETLAAVVEKTVALLDFDAGAVYFVEKGGASAVRRADTGLYHLYFPDAIAVGDGGDDWPRVFSDGRASYGEAYLGVAHAEGELGVYSRAVVPVSLPSGAVIGALAIANSSFHSFSPLEKETLEVIGREVGGIIHKAALADDFAAAKTEADLYLDVLTHDINNANNVAIGYLEMLREEVAGEQAVFAGKCLSGVRQSCKIIDQVRVLRACQQEPVLRAVPLDPVVRSVVDGFPGASITYGGTAAVVRADDLLPRIFENLIGNSLKHGGADIGIAIDAAEAGDGVEVRVSDTGPGIPPSVRDRIFERFFRYTRSRPGQGLGLFIVGTLVHRYGGVIRVEDRVQGRPEEGIAFCITLRKA